MERRNQKNGTAAGIHTLADFSTWLSELDSERRRLASELDRRRSYDGLTGLANRALVKTLLENAALAAQHSGDRIGVLVVDLANFRAVNATLGHAAGDQILVEAAQRLLAGVSEQHVVARLSGDEFCILIPGLVSVTQMDALAAAVMGAFEPCFAVQDRDVFIGLHVGGAVYPDDADGPEQVLRYADLAMSAARGAGSPSYRRFSSAISADVARKSRIAALLRGAFGRGEFHLQYQPLVDSQTGLIVEAEALLRWRSPELGNVQPDQFIPIAEETGLIVALGSWAMQTACMDAADWCRSLGRPIGVAVNVSPRQLLSPAFCDDVREVLARSGLTPELLKIEITEGSLVTDVEICQRVLQDLRGLGVVLALDDFGTGYSALSYLQKFEFDVLKLDQSFIRKTQPGTPAAALAASIIAMATCLGMRTVGEGVETEAHVQMLKSNGCDLMQGFLFSRPITRHELIALIGNPNPPPIPLAAAA